ELSLRLDPLKIVDGENCAEEGERFVDPHLSNLLPRQFSTNRNDVDYYICGAGEDVGKVVDDVRENFRDRGVVVVLFEQFLKFRMLQDLRNLRRRRLERKRKLSRLTNRELPDADDFLFLGSLENLHRNCPWETLAFHYATTFK